MIVDETAAKDHPGHYDFVHCGLEPEDFELKSVARGMRVRVQREDGSAFAIDDRRAVSSIDPFYETPVDTTPPTVSDVAVTDVSDERAVVSWGTDTPTTEKIRYRETSCSWCTRHAGRSLDESNITYSRAHQVPLTDLAPDTEYSVQIFARDEALDATGTDEFTFHTDPAGDADQNPSVAVTSPERNATVGGTTTLAADAADDAGVDHVEFLVDGTPHGPSSTAPDQIEWDTTILADGAYSVTAIAVDGAGNTSIAAPRTATVRNDQPAANVLLRDDFDAPNGTDWDDARWRTLADRGTVGIRDNEGRLQVKAHGNATAIASIEPTRNAEVLLRSHLDEPHGKHASFLWLRAQPDGNGQPTGGYGIRRLTNGDTARVIKRVGGANTTIAKFTWPVDERPRWLRWHADGERIRIRLWEDGASEPRAWTVATSDGDVTEAGTFLLNLKGNGDGAPTHVDTVTVTDLDDA